MMCSSAIGHQNLRQSSTLQVKLHTSGWGLLNYPWVRSSFSHNPRIPKSIRISYPKEFPNFRSSTMASLGARFQTRPRSTSPPSSPDEIHPRSPDEREELYAEHSPEDYFHLGTPVMDTFRSTQFPSRRRHRSRILWRPTLEAEDGSTRGSVNSTGSHERSILEEPYFEHGVLDLRALEYLEPYDHNLMCAICHCPFVAPVRLDCDHVFCKDCVDKALLQQTRHTRCCPTCRKPTTISSAISMPRLLDRILDELVVKCPLYGEGCLETMTRGSVKDHTTIYCSYKEIQCPSEGCCLPIRRKDVDKARCRHRIISCKDCKSYCMEKDLDNHLTTCPLAKANCPDCSKMLLRSELQSHIETCPQAKLTCLAAPYGCDFSSRKSLLEEHTKTCALSKVAPFLAQQAKTLELHSASLTHLRHRNALLESSLFTIQSTLSSNPATPLINGVSSPPALPEASSSSPEIAPFDSTAAHLLSLHESLRLEVDRVSAAVAELDAKATLMIMNETLRVKEDVAHTNAAIGSMRCQMHWLMSARLQGQQRAAMVSKVQARGEGAGASASTTNASSIAEGLRLEMPVRRLSNEGRQETKL